MIHSNLKSKSLEPYRMTGTITFNDKYIISIAKPFCRDVDIKYILNASRYNISIMVSKPHI